MKRLLTLLIIGALAAVAHADDRTLTGGEYWIDQATNDRVQVSIGNDGQMQFSVDASFLSEGLHTLHYRAQDSEGSYSPTLSWLFYRTAAIADGTLALDYWVDNASHQTQTLTDGIAAFTLDGSQLTEGLHQLHYRSSASNGQYGPVQTWLFYRYVEEQPGASTLEYWIDEAATHESQTVSSAETTFVLDASSIAEGLHKLHYRLNSTTGTAGPEHTWLFYRIAPQPQGSTISRIRIWWNSYQDKAIDVQLPEGTTEYLYQELLTMPEYAKNDGFSRNNTATIHIVFYDDQGNASPVASAEVGYPDVYPPVTTLTANRTADSIALSWTSNEDGVRDWNVYYSENDEPYLLWKSNVTEQSATFRGQSGATYRFIVTARDQQGNYEAIDGSRAVGVTY